MEKVALLVLLNWMKWLTMTNDEFDLKYTEDVFESYAQNNTPGAYRIFWHYGPKKKMITILAITPHP